MQLYSLIVVKSVNLSLKYGNSQASPKGYSTYGLLSGSVYGDYQSGYKFGLLALNVSQKLNNLSQKAQVSAVFGGYLNHWVKHIKLATQINNQGYEAALEFGELQFAGYILIFKLLNSFYQGCTLDSVLKDSHTYLEFSIRTQNQWAIDAIFGCQLLLSNLSGLTNDNLSFDIPELTEEQYLSNCLLNQSFAWICTYKIIKSHILYLNGDFAGALKCNIEADSKLSFILGHFSAAAQNFYKSLNLASHYTEVDNYQKREYLNQIIANQQQMCIWANNAPANFLHKYKLVEAEKARILGEKIEAIELYDQAILTAQENEYIQEEALANELAAKFYLEWGKGKIAKTYMTEAYYCYARWGASSKIWDLEKRYPQLLQPILQQQRLNLNSLEKIATITQTSTSTSTSISNAFDFDSILKASQSISSEIHLDKLLANLLNILINNAGASKCVLMLMRDEDLQVEAVTKSGEEANFLQAIPIDESSDIPVSLIYQVKRNLKTSIINDATKEISLFADSYIIQQQPKALVVTPIINQGKLLGILYLENNLATGTFTKEHIEVINFLCSQAAISLENARLYQQVSHSEKLLQQQLIASIQLSQNHFTAQDDLTLAFQEITAVVARTLNVERVSVWLFTEDRQKFQCANLFELSSQKHSRGIELNVADYPNYFNALSSEFILAVYDAQTDFRTCEFKHGYLIPLNISSMLESAFKINGEIVGVICIEHVQNKRKWLQIECNFARTITNIVLLAIETHNRQKQTDKLQSALQELQKAQMQIVQSEKMSSLGNLVAGIAHEINNPIGFLTGSLNNASDYVKDLLNYTQCVQQNHPHLANAVTDFAEEIDLEFLTEDLPKLINSMKNATERITDITTSLRTFSRADTAKKFACNIHEGIDSTLLILKYRLKANEFRPEIKVIKDYGELPAINCFLGQLNQVFMNILANAIDAIDEYSQKYSFKELQANPQKITVQTLFLQSENIVVIKIKDNASGIPEEVKAKIFDHLFTTKGVGKGTGLGLAIARQIVEETHSGKLICDSILGEGTEFTINLPATCVELH